MQRFFLLIVLALLLIGVSYFHLLINETREAYHVPGDFVSIQAALNAARPEMSIRVDAKFGPYVESLDVLVPRVKLMSVRGQATIRAPSRREHVIRVAAPGVEIAGFSIESGATGILVETASGTQIHDNTITQNAQGIELMSSNENLIKENRILENESMGLLLQASSDNIILKNFVTGNAIGGIFLEQGSQSNVISENLVASSDMAVRLMSSNSNAFTRNCIRESMTVGFSIESSQDLDVDSNFIGQNGIGIHALNALGLLVEGNRIESNGTGLEIVGSTLRILIRRNSFVGNHPFALLNSATTEIDVGGNFWGEVAVSPIDTESNAVLGNVLVDPIEKEPVHSGNSSNACDLRGN